MILSDIGKCLKGISLVRYDTEKREPYLLSTDSSKYINEELYEIEDGVNYFIDEMLYNYDEDEKSEIFDNYE